ncbi:MAG: phosphatidate cytidylyltransferase [Planctomycetia bacterium]|nr:phosphatidate cytidylyltransferase [Planctomycetia bacterium]
MLRTRLWMGAILIALAVGVLLVDQRFAPCYPFLLVLVLGLGLLGCHELLHLLGPERRLPARLCYLSVACLVLVNWVAHLWPLAALPDPWSWIAGVFAAVILAAFLTEMSVFEEPGQSVMRVSLTIWIAAYLGLLSCFLVQLRWLPDPDAVQRGSLALALTIFVPKMGDTGAYFTGRLLGRHPMSPVLSPKKTWEGAAGGMTLAVVTTILINRLGPALTGGLPVEIGFGLTVGLAGLLGDLAESLVKRDCQKKDASQIMPGFGGVLDVIDALLFAAPVAYLWFVWAV